MGREFSMSKIFEWISKRKKLSVIIILLVFLLPICSIIYLNIVMSPSFFANIGIAADSIITYVAGFEAFIGTVYLGFVAAHQSEKANDLNNRMLDNAETQQRFERQPSIMITEVKSGVISNDEINLIFSIINVSSAYTQFTTDQICIADVSTPLLNAKPTKEGVTQHTPIISLKPYEELPLYLKFKSNDVNLANENLCKLFLKMQNSIGEIYLEIVSFKLKLTISNSIIIGKYSYRIIFLGNEVDF